MDVSFIIPAYNAEKTIKRTINSILNQNKNNLEYEILVVNDGSSDNTNEIMVEYKENLKIRYFKKENGGLSDARNFGITKANGKYLIFVDSDDYISNNLLKDIQNYISEKYDLIKWNPIYVDEKGNELYKIKSVFFENLSGEDGFNKLFGNDKLIESAWSYAIKKELIMKFPMGRYHEDFAVMPLIILKAKTMVSINKYEYYYVQSENSIIRTDDKKKIQKKLEDKLKHFDNLISKTQSMHIDERTKENIGIFCTNSMLVNLKELSGNIKKWYIKELKSRKILKYLKIRTIKQLLKKIILGIIFIFF